MSKLPIVAIVGRPNVGKSSLFNRLVGKRQAVVTEEAGTTRDPVQGQVSWNGRSFWLIDTAGFGSPADQLARDVQAQIEEARAAADAIVVVIEAATTITTEDRQIAKLALKTGKPLLLVVNKIDTSQNKLPADAQRLGVKTMLGVSAIHGTGSGELLDELIKLIPARRAAKEEAIPTIALLGRPNVGKSSLFNALIGAGKAIVSEAPGTTRDINQAEITDHGQRYRILDTAGIRRIGKTKAVEHFSILRTTSAISEADVGILIIDASEPAVALDQKIAGMVKEAGKGLILAVNKWDLVKDQETAQKQLEKRLQQDFPFVWWAPLVLTSAVSAHNVKKLIELAKAVMKNQTVNLPTRELNRVLQATLASHPPAGLKNRHPKLNYVTQTGTKPPEVTLFGAHLEFLHWSYKRYLENELRKVFELSGTPLVMQFRSKYKEVK